jgi:hypothetical protein
MHFSWIKSLLIVLFLGCFLNCDKTKGKSAAYGEVTEIVGGQFFVAPDGNDSGPGTIENPWRTWTKAFTQAHAGDTVYFRGGVYYSTSDNGGERGFNSGSPERPICFFNYPGETPVLDCQNRDIASLGYNRGITLWHVENIHIKGLQVRNVYQRINSNVVGVDAWNVGNITFENMLVHHVAGEAYVVADYHSTIQYLNCDAHNMNDSLRTAVYPTPGSPGQNGAGFHFRNYRETTGAEASKLYYIGCRAWAFSDNGFAGTSVGYVEWDSCWAFDGGALSGEGCGFKYASIYRDNNTLPLARLMKNCIGAINGAYGFSPNNSGDTPLTGHYFNNTAYYNGYKGDIGHGLGYGWIIMRTNASEAPSGELYANNLAYKNEKSDAHSVRSQAFNQKNNSWNLSLTITDNDFLSLDWTELKKPRKADGSLPDIDFLKPVKESPLLNAGIDVGLPFSGAAPDLGAFEQ